MARRFFLHDAHVAAGAKLETVGEWERPVAYGDAAAEYAAVRRATGAIDRGDAGVLEVTGRDRAAFLDALVSNDVKSLAPGQGRAAGLLDVHGKVELLLTVLTLDDRMVLLLPPGTSAYAMEAFDKYLFAEKAAFEDVTEARAAMMLAGPDAPAVLARLAGVAPPADAWSSVAARVADADVMLVSGDGETGEREVWILSTRDAAATVWQTALAAGAHPVGWTARESLRIETGTPLFGTDVDGSVLLPELPTERLVSGTKGCYPGQEVVVRIRDRGHVNRHFRGCAIEGTTVPPRGAPIESDGATIGAVTSATWSIGLDRPLALGFVRRQHAAPGTRVVVRAGATALAAIVSNLPFAR